MMNDQPSNQNEATTSMTSSGSKRRARSAAEVRDPRKKLSGIINGRVRRVLVALQVLGNVGKLSASKNQLSEQDANMIGAAMQDAVDHCKRRLLSAATGQQLDVEFDLDQERHG